MTQDDGRGPARPEPLEGAVRDEGSSSRSDDAKHGGRTRPELKILVVSGAALVVLLIAFGVAARSARAREDRLEALDRALHEDAERNELEARLQRSLEMAHTEAGGVSAGRASAADQRPGPPRSCSSPTRAGPTSVR